MVLRYSICYCCYLNAESRQRNSDYYLLKSKEYVIFWNLTTLHLQVADCERIIISKWYQKIEQTIWSVIALAIRAITADFTDDNAIIKDLIFILDFTHNNHYYWNSIIMVKATDHRITHFTDSEMVIALPIIFWLVNEIFPNTISSHRCRCV